MYARNRFASIRHPAKRLLTLLVALGLLAGGHALHSSRLAAQAAAPAPAARNSFTPSTSPHPYVRTSGAVGTPTTLRRSQPVGGVNAAALRSTNDWTADLEDDFEQGLTASWQVFDDSENGLNQQWG